MKNIMLLILLMFLVPVEYVFADGILLLPGQLEAYLIENGIDPDDAGSRRMAYAVVGGDGTMRLGPWAVPGVDAPSEMDLMESSKAPDFVSNWKAARNSARAEAKEAEIQFSKSPERKKLENDFFGFIQLVLLAADDPRKDQTPTPKLGFEELTPMIEGIKATDPMGAVMLTLKGFSVDSALKRYDVKWWDNVTEHAADE